MRSYCFWAVMLAVLALVLYDIKYNVHSAQKETRTLEAQLVKERTRLQMVELEWTMLTRPERIKVLVEKHLRLQALHPEQVHHTDGAMWRVANPATPEATEAHPKPTLAGVVRE
jgi:hypothetical protein